MRSDAAWLTNVSSWLQKFCKNFKKKFAVKAKAKLQRHAKREAAPKLSTGTICYVEFRRTRPTRLSISSALTVCQNSPAKTVKCEDKLYVLSCIYAAREPQQQVEVLGPIVPDKNQNQPASQLACIEPAASTKMRAALRAIMPGICTNMQKAPHASQVLPAAEFEWLQCFKSGRTGLDGLSAEQVLKTAFCLSLCQTVAAAKEKSCFQLCGVSRAWNAVFSGWKAVLQ